MYTTYQRIVKVFENYPQVLFGFTDIDFSEYKTKYAGAFVFAVPYGKMMKLCDYEEEAFEHSIHQASGISSEIIKKLDEEQMEFEKPPISQTSEETLTAPLSFKFAAVHAGLGWIGKNGVLVTEKYGPRVRLSALLINFDFPSGSPILESKCPKNCFACVDACPHRALTGQQWKMDMQRSEIIDFQLCNQKRSVYIKTHNRKHSCGLCMVACPFGI